MDGWCDFYDMAAAGCSHCTGRTGDPTALDDIHIVATFTAHYPGQCANCSRRYDAGTRIGLLADNHGYACGRCLP